MQITFTPDQEAQLKEIAQRAGTRPAQWVKNAVLQRWPVTPVFVPLCAKGLRPKISTTAGVLDQPQPPAQ